MFEPPWTARDEPSQLQCLAGRGASNDGAGDRDGRRALMIQGYPSGPAAYVSAEDGRALREALDAAFGGAGWVMDVPPIVKPRI